MEFDEIARLFRPLTFGAPEARRLLDDAAVLPGRSGFELVVTQDAMVEGVHFLPDDPPDQVGRKLLRVNLSDLAAKAAEPYAAFLSVGWGDGWDAARRESFASGLGQDLAAFGCALMGGDTVRTPGAMFASLTLLGWAPTGRAVERAGAQPGDAVLVSGVIGDGGLGLEAARGGLSSLPEPHRSSLARRYRLPEPRLELRQALRNHASAAADCSDGLLSDAGHIARASGRGVEIDLAAMPLSRAAQVWLSAQPEEATARMRLATAGDDYEVICAASLDEEPSLIAEARSTGVEITRVGRVVADSGVHVRWGETRLQPERLGWTHD